MDEYLSRTFDALGHRLRQLRSDRNVTLTELAEETGISASTLSRLESGLRRPTLQQLLPLARAYNLTLDDLVDAPPTGDPRINLRPIKNGDGSTIIPLTRHAGGIQAYKFVLRPTPPNPTCEPTKATTGCTSSLAGSDWCSATTTSSSNPARSPSSIPARHTGSAPPRPDRSSSSASSDVTANEPTSALPHDQRHARTRRQPDTRTRTPDDRPAVRAPEQRTRRCEQRSSTHV